MRWTACSSNRCSRSRSISGQQDSRQVGCDHPHTEARQPGALAYPSASGGQCNADVLRFYYGHSRRLKSLVNTDYCDCCVLT
eukprot:397224-Prymnesium_polylepis.2